jgi:6-phosphogluconolactonase
VPQQAKVVIESDPESLADAAARLLVAKGKTAVADRGVFALAVSGGSTPKRLFELLADESGPYFNILPWTHTHIFWVDERHVPPDSKESNYRMTREAMLSHAPIPGSNIHRIISENPSAEDAAVQYETELKEFFNGLPQFDLTILGLGEDGHTASIFPGSPVLNESNRFVAAPWVEKLNTFRITLTLPVLNNSLSTVFLVSGKGKSEILLEVLQGKFDPARLPSQAIQPANGELKWLVDTEAASLLGKN